MLYVAASAYYDENNEFRLHEIYVSDESQTYILKQKENYTPYPYPIRLQDLKAVTEDSVYPLYLYSKTRQYNDNDAKSLAFYLRSKVAKADMSQAGAEKTLYDVIANFGEPVK